MHYLNFDLFKYNIPGKGLDNKPTFIQSYVHTGKSTLSFISFLNNNNKSTSNNKQ